MHYITGDLHGTYDLPKLGTRKFQDQKKMTKSDYVIIAGDGGIVWDNAGQDRYIQTYLNERAFTTLWIDGNHENHDLIDNLPVSTWNGGKVHLISDSIIHLMRGQVFIIDGVKIFTFGGATSIDKAYRKEGKSWWARELPSIEECVEGLENLEAHNWEVDYVITHDCSDRMFDKLARGNVFLNGKTKTQLSVFLEEIETHVKFKKWFFGHYHDDIDLDEKHKLIYEKIVRIV